MSVSAALSTAVRFKHEQSGATLDDRGAALFERYMRWYGAKEFSDLASHQSALKPAPQGDWHLTASDVRMLDAALLASGRIIHEGEFR